MYRPGFVKLRSEIVMDRPTDRRTDKHLLVSVSKLGETLDLNISGKEHRFLKGTKFLFASSFRFEGIFRIYRNCNKTLSSRFPSQTFSFQIHSFANWISLKTGEDCHCDHFSTFLSNCCKPDFGMCKKKCAILKCSGCNFHVIFPIL